MTAAPQGFPKAGGGGAPGIADQGQGGVLTSYRTISGNKAGGNGPPTIFDRWGNMIYESSGYLPVSGVNVVLTRKSGGGVTQIKTDGKGNFTLGDLAPGDYAIELSGRSLEPAIDKLVGKQQPGGTGANGPAILIALLLPAVQAAREAGSRRADAPASAVLVERAFARGTPDQVVHIGLMIRQTRRAHNDQLGRRDRAGGRQPRWQTGGSAPH